MFRNALLAMLVKAGKLSSVCCVIRNIKKKQISINSYHKTPSPRLDEGATVDANTPTKRCGGA